ncbi:MAG: rhodanese-like domain-containing protein [Ferruginibacter sp.]
MKNLWTPDAVKMKTILLSGLFLLVTVFSSAQFRNDNVLYKTIDPFDLCKALEQSPGYVLLDVRSKGEYEDTSMYKLNYGRLKHAINISIRELGQRIHELDAYKNKPVFIYCSHSQRSRRASKMLADSGFTNVNNINGGLTSFHYLAALKQNCLRDIYETKKQFHFISAAELCEKINVRPAAVFLLDVRPDSLFMHLGTNEKENALGALAGTVHIALASLQDKLTEIPVGKEIVITDLYGQDAAEAAELLLSKGYKDVGVLIEGMDRLVSLPGAAVPCRKNLYKETVPYKILSAGDFAAWVKSEKTFMLVDIRPLSEFNNTDTVKYRNIGHLENAVHIPAAEMNVRWNEVSADKNATIVLYGFGGGKEAFEAAKLLSGKSFKNVYVLYDGLFAVRWTAANIKGYNWIKDLVKDVPEENK